MNSFTASGWVKFVEAKTTATGKNITRFQLSIRNPTKPGDKATYTNLRVQYWGDLALADGDQVLCHGEFYSTSYESKDGSKKYDSGLKARVIAKIDANGKTGALNQTVAGDSEDLPF